MVTAADLQAKADAVTAALDAFVADGGILEYTTSGGVTVKRAPITDLMKLRDSYLAQAAAARPGGSINYHRRGSV